MFHQEDITVKIFNGEMRNISWDQFFTYTQEIFAEAAAGAKTYENYFGIPEETHDSTPKEIPKPTPKPVSNPIPEHDVRPEPEIAPAQQPESVENVKKTVDNHEEGQKTAVPEKEDSVPGNPKAEPHSETPESQIENIEKSQETALTEPEPQIPGQDSIENHPEYMPEPEEQPESNLKPELQEDHLGEANEMVPEVPEIAPAQSNSEITEVIPKTRKDYIDTLTAYGTAEYIAKSMRQFANKTYSTLLDPAFWNEWLNGKVDHNGRPWED